MCRALCRLYRIELIGERAHLAHHTIRFHTVQNGLGASRAKVTRHGWNGRGFALVDIRQVAGSMDQFSRAANSTFHIGENRAATSFLGRPPRLPFSREAKALAWVDAWPPTLPIWAAIHRFEPRKPSSSAGM